MNSLKIPTDSVVGDNGGRNDINYKIFIRGSRYEMASDKYTYIIVGVKNIYTEKTWDISFTLFACPMTHISFSFTQIPIY